MYDTVIFDQSTTVPPALVPYSTSTKVLGSHPISN